MTMDPEITKREYDKFEQNSGDSGTDVRVAIKNATPIPVSIDQPIEVDVTIGDEIIVKQAVHDDLNANVNLQVGDADVTPLNRVPVDIGAGPFAVTLDEPVTVEVTSDSKISGTVDGQATGTERTFVNNLRQQVLASHDLIPVFTWLDFGTKNERYNTITYTSPSFVGVTVVQTYNYTLVGTKYRLDSAPFVTTPGG